MRYHFTNELTASSVDEVVEFTLGPRLWISDAGYPDLTEWGQKLYGDLHHGRKQALVAFDHQRPAGSIIYRRSAEDRHTLEIRRITVHPSHEGRYVSDFLLRNAELQAQAEFQATEVLVDSKTNAFGMIHFLLRNGYKITDQLDLYGLGAGDDFLYHKRLAAPMT
jgi:ribosomal protein S18 acetylase RimI-like enzyme